MKLAGYKLVDDEGVPTEDVTLVEEGRLVGLPQRHQSVDIRRAGATAGDLWPPAVRFQMLLFGVPSGIGTRGRERR